MQHIIRILRVGKTLWKSYALIGILTTVISIGSILLPLLSGKAIDEIRKGSDADLIVAVLLATGIFAIDFFQTLLNNWNGYIGDQVSTKLQKKLSEEYFSHLLSLPQSYFDTELSGKIISRLSRSINQITNFIQAMSNNFLQFIFTTVFSLIAVALYSWQIALLLFALYPIFTFMTVRSSGAWQAFQKQKNEHNDIASGRFAEAVSQVKVVKSFVQEKRELKFFDKHYAKIVDINKPQSAHWHKEDIKRRLVLNVIFYGVYLLIFVQGVNGSLTPGEAVSLILYAMNIRIPIFTISWLVEQTQRAVADSKDYFEIMELTPSIIDRPGAGNLSVTKGEIRFENVHFGYGSEDVLKNIDFSVQPNTKIALVGESGEGKTTITSLLMRLYEPRNGRIMIDGQDIQLVTQASLRSYIGVVFQDPSLFSGTIEENISYANPKASKEAIQAAAKAANAHEFIEKLEHGYSTQIGERGLKLSGGQKQRIAIARALLKDAPILILDEATSSLDSKSERMVQEALDRLMKNRTTLIVAHRLSTIQNVDQIITLKNGTIDEIGSPKQLASSGGIYDQLLQLQQGNTEKSAKKLQKYDIAS